MLNSGNRIAIRWDKSWTARGLQHCLTPSQPRTARHLPDSLSHTQVTLPGMSDQLQFVGSKSYQDVLASSEDGIIWRRSVELNRKHQ